MVYRIDLQHFLTHAIDHFTIQQLSHFQYVIISAAVKNGGTCANISKINELYPPPDIVEDYFQDKDEKLLENRYMDFLKTDEHGRKSNWSLNIIYNIFVDNLISHHQDLMIVCDETENPYIDVLSKYLEKMVSIQVIDLNQFFAKGYVESMYFDRNKIRNKAVDIRRKAGEDEVKYLKTTRDGRLKLMKQMNRREKLDLLRTLGIKVTAKDKNHLDDLLEEWANELYDEEES